MELTQKFKDKDKVTYIGELNDFTYEKDLRPNDKGVIENVHQNPESVSYDVKFDSGLMAFGVRQDQLQDA